MLEVYIHAVADPGFPVGEGVDLQRGRFSVKMYAKTKELGPIDPPMHRRNIVKI